MLNKKITILILVLAVMAVVSGCVKKSAENKVVADNNQGEEQQNKEKTEDYLNKEDWKDAEIIYSPEGYDYTGWKTFTYDELGYKIKYPADWTPDDQREYSLAKEVIINPPNAEDFTSYISILIDNRKLNGIRDIYLDLSSNLRSIDNKYEPYKERKIIFSGKEAYRYFDGNVKNSEKILVIYNKKIYSLSTQKINNPEVKQILASFGFLE